MKYESRQPEGHAKVLEKKTNEPDAIRLHEHAHAMQETQPESQED